MSVTFVKNIVGLTPGEDAMKDIPHALAELYAHVTLKTVQTGVLVGTLIVGPISALRKSETRSLVGVRRRMARCGLWGLGIGVLAGPVLTYARLTTSGATEESIYDRSYRLRKNRGQVRVDRGWLVGWVGGAGLSMALKKCPVFGSMVGMSAGVIAAAYYNGVVGEKSHQSEKSSQSDEGKSDDKPKSDKK